MSSKYICIHGHFYQPPRENPWLNEVEIQESAYPYHDWNERISAECYARNSASRILSESGKIKDIINNYSYISFNFGPTLLTWLERKMPDVYDAILQADRDSMENFSGHGSALAQVYNHIIMPLANERDKHTQVIWGIEDFKHRFGRHPEGMWLAETAVNTETLEVLAEHDIKFTILSPYQAKRVRKIGEQKWQDASDAKVDPKNSYICHLPSGKSINLFFYDGPVSQGIAFENLLENGEAFAERLLGALTKENRPQIMNIGTDGETYGHHHRYGEMALSYAIDYIQELDGVQMTIYGEYLEKHPPEYEVEILENTAWSCAHGVERWRSNCGCNTGGSQGWTQEWREPLRDSLEFIQEKMDAFYEKHMDGFTSDPWKVRNDYIKVILDRSEENVENFLKEQFGNLEQHEKVKVLKLLEMQYHCLLMYTSCGWFFDEVTGIETMQDILYASRALQLANEVEENDFEEQFIGLLEKTPSNIEEFGNAANAYKKFVEPAKINMLRVGAHYAVSSLFHDYPKNAKIYSFKAYSEKCRQLEAGRQQLITGKVRLKSEITFEELSISYAVLHLGDHHLFGGVRPFMDDDKFESMRTEVIGAFKKSNVYSLIALLDKHFGSHNYSFWHLFKDDQRSIMSEVLENALEGIEGSFQQMYDNNYPLIQALKEMNMPLPGQLKMPVDFMINTKLRQLLDSDDIDLEELETVIDEIIWMQVELEEVTISFLTTKLINELLEILSVNPNDVNLLGKVVGILRLVKKLPLDLDLWQAQNHAFIIRQEHYESFLSKCSTDDKNAQNWCKYSDELVELLNMQV